MLVPTSAQFTRSGRLDGTHPRENVHRVGAKPRERQRERERERVRPREAFKFNLDEIMALCFPLSQ